MRKLLKSDYCRLVQNFPFLYPRNVWTDEPVQDYCYDWCLGVDELPDGWVRLFLLYCKHMREELVEFNYLDKFRFSQIKEKYGSMRLYNNGVPKDSNCDNLECIYDQLSTFVCQTCGRSATYKSIGWIEQQCAKHRDGNSIKKSRKSFVVRVESNHPGTKKAVIKRIDCREYWNEYINCLKMTDDVFLDYILVD